MSWRRQQVLPTLCGAVIVEVQTEKKILALEKAEWGELPLASPEVEMEG